MQIYFLHDFKNVFLKNTAKAVKILLSSVFGCLTARLFKFTTRHGDMEFYSPCLRYEKFVAVFQQKTLDSRRKCCYVTFTL